MKADKRAELSTGIKVTGLNELRKAIKDAEDKELKLQLRQVYKAAADIVADAAQKRVPIGETGDLWASIVARASPWSASVDAGNKDVPYAGPIHWGWEKKHIQAQPFISEGLKDQWKLVQDTFEKAMDRLTEQIHP